MAQQQDQSFYQLSSSEIFWKNFLVGFSRSLGAILVQAVFFILMTFIIIRLTAPLLAPFAALMSNPADGEGLSISPSLLEQLTSPGGYFDEETTSTTR